MGDTLWGCALVAQGIEHRSPKAGVGRSNRLGGTANLDTSGKQIGILNDRSTQNPDLLFYLLSLFQKPALEEELSLIAHAGRKTIFTI